MQVAGRPVSRSLIASTLLLAALAGTAFAFQGTASSAVSAARMLDHPKGLLPTRPGPGVRKLDTTLAALIDPRIGRALVSSRWRPAAPPLVTKFCAAPALGAGHPPLGRGYSRAGIAEGGAGLRAARRCGRNACIPRATEDARRDGCGDNRRSRAASCSRSLLTSSSAT